MNRTFTITSPLSAQEALQQLNQHTDPTFSAMWSGMRNSSKPLTGKVKDRGFTIRLFTDYNHFLRPVIRGNIYPTTEGSRIEASIRPPILVALPVLWIGGLLSSVLSAPPSSNPGALTGVFVMITLGIMIFTVCYLLRIKEIKRLKELLKIIF